MKTMYAIWDVEKDTWHTELNDDDIECVIILLATKEAVKRRSSNINEKYHEIRKVKIVEDRKAVKP